MKCYKRDFGYNCLANCFIYTPSCQLVGQLGGLFLLH